MESKKTSDAGTPAVRFEARKWQDAYKGTDFDDKPESPERWAVYAVDSGVRMAYSKSKEAAKTTAEKWNSGKVPEKIANKAESAADLRKLLKPGDVVKTILRNVSRSGMSRRISMVIARGDEVEDITWDAARVMEDSVKQGGKYVQDAGMVVGGCGMDMGFHIVYSLSRILFPDGFMCCGKGDEHYKGRCPSNDHSNGDRNYRPHKHTGDGGYALRQQWL